MPKEGEMACARQTLNYTTLNDFQGDINGAVQSQSVLCSTLRFYVHNRSYGPLSGPTSISCGGLWPFAEAFAASSILGVGTDAATMCKAMSKTLFNNV